MTAPIQQHPLNKVSSKESAAEERDFIAGVVREGRGLMVIDWPQEGSHRRAEGEGRGYWVVSVNRYDGSYFPILYTAADRETADVVCEHLLVALWRPSHA